VPAYDQTHTKKADDPTLNGGSNRFMVHVHSTLQFLFNHHFTCFMGKSLLSCHGIKDSHEIKLHAPQKPIYSMVYVYDYCSSIHIFTRGLPL